MRPLARFAVPLLLLAGAATLEGGAEVRVSGGKVDVQAAATPLSEVLDRLAREIGMKVVYEGAPPRQLVSATLQGRTPAEAVLGILEGQGLNYAVVMDRSGLKVQTLMITGAAGPGGSGPGATRPGFNPPAFNPPPRPAIPPHEPEPEPDFVEAEEVPPEEVPEEAPGEEAQEEAPTEKPVPGQPTFLPPVQAFPTSPFAPQPVFPFAQPSPQPDQAKDQTPES